MRYEIYEKRIFDFVLALVLLIVTLLPMIMLCVIIKGYDGGPVLFKQKRFGKNSKAFTLFKFRSMAVRAPQKSNQSFKDMNLYITPIGDFMRKTSLDELPQLLNIIRGEMSFIGPRPMATTDMDVVELRKNTPAENVLPGITGLAQVNGRNLISNEMKVAYDTEYASHITLKNDLKIIVATVRDVLHQRGINRQDGE